MQVRLVDFSPCETYLVTTTWADAREKVTDAHGFSRMLTDAHVC
jgi:hypothetical protein